MTTLLNIGNSLALIGLLLISGCMGDGSASAEYKVGECLGQESMAFFKVESIDGPQLFVIELDKTSSRPVNMDMALGARNLTREQLKKLTCP
ncbi:MAG: hypothetical protein HN509_17340 [Halobacteriovoraceae bacterium]|nr:hypothetical protein [Halobacteriovoraceae bacterium]MBT5094539.1 hypothetical protein [Halobacteriovoraceae bacterium]